MGLCLSGNNSTVLFVNLYCCSRNPANFCGLIQSQNNQAQVRNTTVIWLEHRSLFTILIVVYLGLGPVHWAKRMIRTCLNWLFGLTGIRTFISIPLALCATYKKSSASSPSNKPAGRVAKLLSFIFLRTKETVASFHNHPVVVMYSMK